LTRFFVLKYLHTTQNSDAKISTKPVYKSVALKDVKHIDWIMLQHQQQQMMREIRW